MGVSLKDEFVVSNFSFNHPQPYRFVKSQWNISDGWYIAWRMFWVVWHIGWLIRSIQVEISEYGSGNKWLIYLTNISFLVMTIQSIIYAVIVIYHVSKRKTEPEDFEGETTQWYHKVLWVFTIITFDASIAVTALYWGLVFEELKYALSIVTHAVNSVYTISDIFISAYPVRVLHFVYVMAYALAYMIFSLIYHAFDGTNSNDEPYIYKSLDWSNTGVTVGLAVGVVFVVLPLIHLFQYTLFVLRKLMYEKCCCCGCCGCGNNNYDDIEGDNRACDTGPA